MSGESAPKPRLVQCPKCRKLLPEFPNYDVYKCGGCGTILQAKKRKNRAVNSESNSHETNTAPRNASNLVSDDKQYSNGEKPVSHQENVLRENATSSSSGDCSQEGNGGTGQIENGKCNGEHLVTTQENGLSEKATGSSSGECSLEGNSEMDQIENGEFNGERLVTSEENSLSEKTTSSSSGECPLDGNGERGQTENSEFNEAVISQENVLREKVTSSSLGECSLNGNGGRGQTENGKCNGEQLVALKLSNEELANDLRRSDIDASAELSADNSVEMENDTNLQLKGEELSNENMPLEGAGEQLISALGTEDARDEKSALLGVKSEVDIARSESEIVEEINKGNLLQEGAEQKLTSGSDEEYVSNGKSVLVGASPEEDVSGTNNTESKELNNGDLLLQGTEEEKNKHASDRENPKDGQSVLLDAKPEMDISGNESTAERLSNENFVSEKGSISFVSPPNLKEGTSDDHVSSPQNIHHSFDNIRSADTFDNSLEISGALGEFSKSPTTRSSHAYYDGSVSSNDGVDEQNLFSLENTYTTANGSEGGSRKGKGLVNSMLYGDLETQHQSYPSNRKYHVMKDGTRNQNEALETTRHDHAHWMRTKKDEFPFKTPLPRSGSHSGYESGSPSNQTYDELYGSSSYVSPDSLEDPDLEKLKLLRMVFKLQEQLNRTSYANRETNERLFARKHISAHQNHEGRFYHGVDYPRWDASSSHGINWRQRHNFSRIPYSAEATSSTTHHVDHPCIHCYSQEWQSLGEFPPRVLYQHEDLYKPHLGHTCCLSHHSYPSSPQWLMTSKLIHGRETKSCDQRHMVPEMNYIREKPSLTKRHYRPVAGGAPFVTCHKCLNLLQLPADFLLFKRVCHRLKCGACQEVLKFSLQSKSHIVSYAPSALGPLSSDLDPHKKVIDGINPHSEPHAADPVSYSDDYGNSISKSYSSEGDPVSVAPFHALNGSAPDNPLVSPGTVELVKEKEKIASRGGPSTSKASSSEMEAQRLQPKSSSLHQLMGYATPSQVIRGAPSSVEGKEAMLNERH